MTTTYNLALDVRQREINNTGITMTQGDNNAYKLVTKILDGGVEIDYTTVDHARIAFAKTDGGTVYGSMQVQSGGGYTYTLGTNEIAATGNVVAAIILYGGANERISSTRFRFTVQPQIIDNNVIESTTEFDALIGAVELMDSVQQLLQEFPVTVAVGTVTTGAVAAVTNVGTPQAAVLNFVLPSVVVADNDTLGGVMAGDDVSIGADGKMTIPTLATHTANADIHISAAQKTKLADICPVTTYTGDGAITQIITLPLTPSAVIVYPVGKTPFATSASGDQIIRCGFAAGGSASKGITLSGASLTVTQNQTTPADGEVMTLNESGTVYAVLAIR